ncbi:MAG: isoleucine--tRNA ligase [bacterium]|nr:isoleucine--tRNA ligase [bacterium]
MSEDFPALEREILKFWERERCFEKLVEKNQGGPKWSFLDGPITANNPMGVHHAWGRTYKDLFQRFHAMTGHDLRYQNGFDCQGLWVEVEVEKELKFKSKRDIEVYGIDRFVEKCKERVEKYAAIQTDQSKRLGYWMKWDDSYFTMADENNYTIWQFLKRCHQRGFLYHGLDSMPWCPRCGTGISQHEIHGEDRPKVKHDSPAVRLPIRGREREYLLIWTTTPWTLTSNVACAVHPELTYARVRQGEDSYYLVEDRVEAMMMAEKGSLEVLERFPGERLVGWEYDGPFDELEAQGGVSHRVIPWKDVSAEEGTGIVHIAPGCGKEDYDLGKQYDLPAIGPIDEAGVFYDGFGPYTGQNAAEVAEQIFASLREKELLYRVDPYEHAYPICWRCKTQLLFRLVDEWYVSMGESEPPSGLRKEIIEVTKQTSWIPEVGQKLEIEWLNNMHDWMISKKRYWGLALPIYRCEDCDTFDVIGSKEELRERAVEGWEEFEGHTPHRPWVDAVKISCPECGKKLSRIADVGNPWLDAGIVPYSTMKYNTDRAYWEQWFPADWISESFPGQFRNWFYAILAMSTVMENRPPFKLNFGYRLMKDEDGEEMHKSKGNAPEFNEAADREGADAMRWLFASHNPGYDLRFGYHKIHDARNEFLTLWNVYQFYLTYARIDGFVPAAGHSMQSRSDLDRWILSRLEKLIENAHLNYGRSSVHLFMREVRSFIAALSRWYLRRSRRRFWKSDDDGDKRSAYQTLWECLETTIKLLAPVIPFTTESMYQHLVRDHDADAPVSVHLCDFPRPGENNLDEALLEAMETVRALVEQGHRARQKAQLKVRQPLAEIRVAAVPGLAEKVDPHMPLIVDELNVKAVNVVDSMADLYQLSARLDGKIAGPKYKRFSGPLKEAVASADPAELESRLAVAGEVALEAGGETFQVPAEDIVIEKSSEEGWELSEGSGLLVALDTRLSHELVLEGLSRELVRKIQDLRKKTGLEVADRIRIEYVADDELAAVVTRHADYIAGEILAESIERRETLDPTGKSVKLGAHQIEIAITKVSGN